MSWPTTLTLLVPLVVAIAGYFATYLYNLRLAQRKDRLERVSRQLSELYGPLLALATAGLAVWNAFLHKHQRSTWWSDEPPMTTAELAEFRLWVTEVLQPLNGRAVEIIVRNADLLEESEMPRCLLDLCAHVSAYTPLIKAWERGDLTQHRAAIDFPFELHAYVQDRFRTLKAEQNELIGKVQAEAA